MLTSKNNPYIVGLAPNHAYMLFNPRFIVFETKLLKTILRSIQLNALKQSKLKRSEQNEGNKRVEANYL